MEILPRVEILPVCASLRNRWRYSPGVTPLRLFVEFLRSMSSAGKIAFGAIREPDLHP